MLLSPEQTAAVTTDHPLVLVCAGAGSGKTTCLVARIKHIINSGVNPSTIIAVTFTNNAAAEMRKRLVGIKLGWLGTLHALMLRIVREEYPGASVLDEESTEQLLESVVDQLKYRGTKESLKAVIALGNPADKPRKSLTELVATEYYAAQIRSSAFSFDSLLVIGLSCISRLGPCSHFLVDEFADSSDADWLLYNAITADNKWFCGDDSQALYGWRGGNVQHMLDLTTRMSARTFLLQINRRSDIAICLAADSLIRHNANRITKVNIPQTECAGSVTVTSHSTADEELLKLAQNIRDQQEAGTPLKEMAVLVRTNNLVSHFSEGLKAFSIAVCERSEASLPEDWKRTMLLLSVIASPNNDFLMKRWINCNSQTDAIIDYSDAENEIFIRHAATCFKSINRSRPVIWSDNPPAVKAVAFTRGHNISAVSYSLLESSLLALPGDATASDLLMELRSNPPMATAGSVDGVYVGTVHSAKGREWDNVFLPAFEDEIIPGHKVDQIEDERRIAYVALTRARHFIGISWSEQRSMPWRPGIQFHHPSRFITECGITT